MMLACSEPVISVSRTPAQPYGATTIAMRDMGATQFSALGSGSRAGSRYWSRSSGEAEYPLPDDRPAARELPWSGRSSGRAEPQPGSHREGGSAIPSRVLLHSELHAGPEFAFSQARHRGTTACSATAGVAEEYPFYVERVPEGGMAATTGRGSGTKPRTWIPMFPWAPCMGVCPEKWKRRKRCRKRCANDSSNDREDL